METRPGGHGLAFASLAWEAVGGGEGEFGFQGAMRRAERAEAMSRRDERAEAMRRRDERAMRSEGEDGGGGEGEGESDGLDEMIRRLLLEDFKRLR